MIIISLFDLVSMCKIQKNCYFQTRSERLVIIIINRITKLICTLPRVSLRASCRPKLLWKTKTWTNIILKVQLSKKAGLINKKTCLAFPYLHPCVAIMKEVYFCFFFYNDNAYFHNRTLHIAIKKIRFCFGVMKYDSRAYE